MNNLLESFDSILDQCITDIRSGKASLQGCIAEYPQYGDELTILLGIADQFSRVPVVYASPEFRAAALSRFTDHIAQTKLAPTSRYPVRSHPDAVSNKNHASSKPPVARRSFIFSLALAIIIVFVLATSGVALAANVSNPGGTLYPLKLAEEQFRLDMAKSGLSQQQLHLEFATRRLVEIDWLVKRNREIFIQQPIDNYLGHTTQLNNYINSADIPDQDRVIIADMVLSSPAMDEGLLSDFYQKIPPEQRSGIKQALDAARQARQDAQQVLAGFPALREQVRKLLLSTMEARITSESGTSVSGVIPESTGTPTPFDITTSQEANLIYPTAVEDWINATQDPYWFATLYPSLVPYLSDLATKYPTLYPTFSNFATLYPTYAGTPLSSLRPTRDRPTRMAPRETPGRKSTPATTPIR